MYSAPIIFELRPGTIGPRVPVAPADPVTLAWHNPREQVPVLDGNTTLVASRFVVQEVVLPSWLTADEWVDDWQRFELLWFLGVDPEWPELWQRSLLPFKPEEIAACVELLNAKSFRSTFRQDMARQLREWLDMPIDDQDETPFLPSEWARLTDRHMPKKITSLLAKFSEWVHYHEPIAADRDKATQHDDTGE